MNTHFTVFALRKRLSSEQNVEVSDLAGPSHFSHILSNLKADLRTVLDDIRSCRKRICAVIDAAKLSDAEDRARSQAYGHALRVFEVEMLWQLKEWGPLLQTVDVSLIHALWVTLH